MSVMPAGRISVPAATLPESAALTMPMEEASSSGAAGLRHPQHHASARIREGKEIEARVAGESVPDRRPENAGRR